MNYINKCMQLYFYTEEYLALLSMNKDQDLFQIRWSDDRIIEKVKTLEIRIVLSAHTERDETWFVLILRYLRWENRRNYGGITTQGESDTSSSPASYREF